MATNKAASKSTNKATNKASGLKFIASFKAYAPFKRLLTWQGFLLAVLLMLLSGCNSNPSVQAPQEPPPVYINEEAYTGEEREVISIINRSLESLNAGKEKEYLELMHSDGPLQGMPSYRVSHTRVLRDIQIQEQRNVFQVVVPIKEKRYGSEDELDYNYVLQRGKQEGDSWKIVDKD
ncbi:hypothetical protein D3C74_112580 [compost metagenome]